MKTAVFVYCQTKTAVFLCSSSQQPMVLRQFVEEFFTEDVILIAVSQSGESPEVLRLVEKISSRVTVISVTNYPKSHLYTMTSMRCGIYAGTEYLTSTKSYTNSLAAMLLLAYRLFGCTENEKEMLRNQLKTCADEMENQQVCVVKHQDPMTAILVDIIPFELGIDMLCKSRGGAAGHITREVKRMAE